MSDKDDARYPAGADGKPVTLEGLVAAGDRRFSPSTARNRDPVREAFFGHVCKTARVLEIGSGTGEHGVHMASAAPDLSWTFTEHNMEALTGIAAWMVHSGHSGLCGPYALNAASDDWGETLAGQKFDTLFSANVVHISPFTVATGMFAGAARVLRDDGQVFLYGPFGRDGRLAAGNERFDADLKRRDASWGVRDLDQDICPLAERNGFTLKAVLDMPSNNFSVVFERN